jgi:hypothetical protein
VSGGMLVEDNTIARACFGVEFWANLGEVLRNVTVSNNVIQLANAQWRALTEPGAEAAAGVFIGPLQQGGFTRLAITNNLVELEPGDGMPVSLTAAVLFFTHSRLLSNCLAADNRISVL